MSPALERGIAEDFSTLEEIIAPVGSSDGAPVLQGIPVVDFNFAMDLIATR
jgi:hypothetical protein